MHRFWYNERQAQANCCNLRRQSHKATAAGIGPGTTIKYLRRTTSGAAGNGLHTTIKHMRGAAGIGLGTTIKHLGRTTSGAAGNGLGTTIKHMRGAAGIGLGTTIK
jgi:hypothetical protein